MNKLHFLSVSFPEITLPLNDPVLVFSLVLFIILLAPIVLRKFRIPGVIGLIVAGVIIGPHGINLLERNDAIILFGTVGLQYIMFLAALELELNEFKKNKYRNLFIGALSFLMPLLLGFPVCYYFLGYSMKPALLIACTLAPNTLITYTITTRLGISKNEAVAVSVGATIIADTLVLLILSVFTGSANGNLDAGFWVQLLISVSLFFVAVFFLLTPLARWFFKNIEGEKTSQYIFVLAMVFLSAFLATLAGMEPIIGSFMAGLALNRLIPHTSPLMNRIEFVGNALFIPFFLISVGMLVDLRTFFKDVHALNIAIALTTVAILSKWLAAYIAQLVFKYSNAQRQLIFGLTTSRAAATLAIILVGFKLGLLDESVLNASVLLILVTCSVASFVTENAGKKIAIAESAQKAKLPELPEKLLVPISNPSTIEMLIDLSVMLKDAASKQPIATLTVVPDDDEAQERIVASKKMLEKAIIHAAATDTKVQPHTRVDLNVASSISRTIKELMITGVIIGWSDKTKPIGKIFGTTLDNLLDNSSQMILVCKIQQPLNVFKRIVITLAEHAEFEEGFELLTKKMLQLASQTGSSIVLYCFKKTAVAFTETQKKLKSPVEVTHHEFDFLYKFLTLQKALRTDDLLVTVCARKGTVSHRNDLDEIPGKLARYFPKHNFIIAYPERSAVSSMEKFIPTEDVEISPIEESLESVAKIGKSLRKVFGKGE